MHLDRRLLLKAVASVIGAQILPGDSFAADMPRSPTLHVAADEAVQALKPYYEMGGILQFVVYDGAQDAEKDSLAAIHDRLASIGSLNESAFKRLNNRHISAAQFFGDWYDPTDGGLIKLGSVMTADGQTLTNPKVRSLEKLQVVSSGGPGVEVGSGGQFAYAYLNPPYGLHGSPAEIQKTFDSIRKLILPETHAVTILDWTSPSLDKVSSYFKAGKEWWGIFLFSIYVPDLQRLTIIAGSATD
ncbi:MAG: hypothetical protein QM647_01885 [Asticcacaulis sp.]|uniref:hypothetical protein n=1 Tax=Asticcacaulis sp. TaxID=1872648 RepID=UPI0039E3DD4F